MTQLDYAHDVYDSSWTTGSLHEWEQAIGDKPIEECRPVLASFPKDQRVKITPLDFTKAWARTHPRDVCPICSGTGMTGDVGMDRSDPCECPEGERMAQLRSDMAPSVLSTGKHLSPEAREYGLAMVAYLRDQNPYLNRRRAS